MYLVAGCSEYTSKADQIDSTVFASLFIGTAFSSEIRVTLIGEEFHLQGTKLQFFYNCLPCKNVGNHGAISININTRVLKVNGGAIYQRKNNSA